MNIKKKILVVSAVLFTAALFAQEAEQTEGLGTKITVTREKEETEIVEAVENKNEENVESEVIEVTETKQETDETDYYDDGN